MASSTARKLVERMRRSKAGWGRDDLHRVYRGFGFELHEGRGHRVYVHPDHPDLRAVVGRHSPLAKGYVAECVKLIDILSERQSHVDD